MANTKKLVEHLQIFDFHALFIELGWSQPKEKNETALIINDTKFVRKQIAQLGAAVYEITSPDGNIPDKNTRKKIHTEITKLVQENLLIFVDEKRSQSIWLWVKQEKGKKELREHDYFKGQPVDLMLSKIARMNFELEDFDEDGNPPPIVEVAKKLKDSLDIEKVTKKFFNDFQTEHIDFLEHIHGIEDERDKRWYASVILNRLMFIYFLQKKFFLDNANQDYLRDKLNDSKAKGENLYFKDFLWKLFFIGFAKPEEDRSDEENKLLGDIPYLNGGLFLPHKLEQKYEDVLKIDDVAFENVFKLFEKYSWNLDDTPGGKADEINPSVLGYIFEKYINDQKSAGAYYTRPEITQYLCEQTIYKVILDKVNSLAEPANNQTPNMFSSNDGGLFINRTYGTMADLLLNLDEFLCRKLWFDILPSLKILDPACGSGAFLVAALKTLLNVYSAVIGKMETLGDEGLKKELDKIRDNHPSISYDIKKRIITNNIYGVDLMEEATEIAKLRLFMSLVTSVNNKNELEPLPNIDFNIVFGNSLIGLLRVSDNEFVDKQQSLFRQSFREIVETRDKNVENYRLATSTEKNLTKFRDQIKEGDEHINEILHEILLKEFNNLKIKYEEGKWDKEKNKVGKSSKRPVSLNDVKDLEPFHWGYNFSKVLNENGGFDAIIANPPWEVFKPNAKEFFQQHSDDVSKKKMTNKEFKKKQNELLEDEHIRQEWLKYQSLFPHVSSYYRGAKQYENQISIVNGKKAGTDINLYKLFLEQCFNLLRKNGRCGIIVQSGIYTDLGTKQLREMLFSKNKIENLFGFSNEKFIFENVHHAQKFCIVIFEKGKQTDKFQAAFRINPREAVKKEELEKFLNSSAEHINISVDLVKKLSPDSFSIMEFKNDVDIRIAEKMLIFPLLGEKIESKWNMSLTREFDMTNDNHLFQTSESKTTLPLYEGKMIHQFTHQFSEPQYWIDEKRGRSGVIKRNEIDEGQKLDYQKYRLGLRAVASNVNTNSLICSALPKNIFCGNSILSSQFLEGRNLIFCIGLLNSFYVDWVIRNKISQNINMFYVYQLPVPRLTENEKEFAPIVERAAKLICTTPEFDDLAKEVGLKSYKNGVTDEAERQKLRAELDAIIAHLYNLTEEEFEYILSTFPIVKDAVKQETLETFRTYDNKQD